MAVAGFLVTALVLTARHLTIKMPEDLTASSSRHDAKQLRPDQSYAASPRCPDMCKPASANIFPSIDEIQQLCPYWGQ